MLPGLFDGGYIAWRQCRFDTIVRHYGPEFFRNKTLLEVGAGHGDLGQMFYDLGARVVSVEGRPEHVAVMRQQHPNLISYVHDLNAGLGTYEHYDIILHTGVLYHLLNTEESIRDSINQSDHLILETEVAFGGDPYFAWLCEGAARDQALNDGSGGLRPSVARVEMLLAKYGAEFERVREGLDSSEHAHRYTWNDPGTNTWMESTRAMWFCKRRAVCP